MKGVKEDSASNEKESVWRAVTKDDVSLTGDRPTGCLHLGHYVGSLRTRLYLQDRCEQWIMVADQQALTDHLGTSQLSDSVIEVVLDYLSVGLDPTKTTIFLQSAVPQIAELSLYYLNLVSVNRLRHNPTVKQEIRQKNWSESIPAGFLTYPVSQAADITAFQSTLVPVGRDQLPMIEQTNEIVEAFQARYGDGLRRVRALIPPHHGRLPGIDGGQKMSKSLGNGIALSEPPDALRSKVMQMYTDPNHIRVDDPGQVEGNVVFTYLDAFASDSEEVKSLKEHYQRGGLGDVTLKKRLVEVLEGFLSPIRDRRAQWDEGHIYDILRQGSKKAREAAQSTLDQVKKSMHMVVL